MEKQSDSSTGGPFGTINRSDSIDRAAKQFILHSALEVSESSSDIRGLKMSKEISHYDVVWRDSDGPREGLPSFPSAPTTAESSRATGESPPLIGRPCIRRITRFHFQLHLQYIHPVALC